MKGSIPAGTFFGKIARQLSRVMGQPLTFSIAALIVIVWAITGPIFYFSDTWQLVINTCSSVVTFLMVFLIQNTQNRDSDAIQVKLDELIRTSKAHNALLDLEELGQEDLDRIKKRYEELAGKARKELKRGRKDTNSPLVKSD
jgi:low affinity Fe/Cu permease